MKFFNNIELTCSETFTARNNKKINRINGISVTGKSIKTWLDDEVINSYFQLISNDSNFTIYCDNSINYAPFERYQKINEIYQVKQSRFSIKHLDFFSN